MQDKIVDLDEIVLDAARRWYEKYEQKSLESRLKDKFPWESVRPVIDTSQLFITTEVPDYTPDIVAKTSGEGSKSVVLFSTTYTNKSEDSALSYSLNTTRTTRSTCTMRLTKGFTCGQEFGIKLALPNNVLEMNAGFSSEITMEKEKEQSIEQELSWSVDTNITVPKQSQVRAELVIEERETRSKFKARASFDGKLVVIIYSRDNLELTRIIYRQLDKVLTEMHGFKIDPQVNSVYYEVEGVCSSRLGVSQNVTVEQIRADKLTDNGRM